MGRTVKPPFVVDFCDDVYFEVPKHGVLAQHTILSVVHVPTLFCERSFEHGKQERPEEDSKFLGGRARKKEINVRDKRFSRSHFVYYSRRGVAPTCRPPPFHLKSHSFLSPLNH